MGACMGADGVGSINTFCVPKMNIGSSPVYFFNSSSLSVAFLIPVMMGWHSSL